MPTIIRSEEHDYQPNPNKIDGFRLLSDISRVKKGIVPKYLNFDFRQLNPKQYSAPYHFHRFAEELFFILSGAATLRTSNGLDVVGAGDLLFFEAGEAGAHQLYNHSNTQCVYLDIRSYIGHDICEYPDSKKIIIVPGGETFHKDEQCSYFDGETNIRKVWEQVLRE